MTPGLVIPIDVQAFCVSAKDAETGPTMKGSTADFSRLPYWPDDADDPHRPGPATSDCVFDEAPTRWTAGVHLHWAMPDALAHGHHDKTTGQTSFAPLPNRWLVTRIVTREHAVQKDLCRSWVVESDRLSPAYPHTVKTFPTATTVPTRPDDYQAPDVPDAAPAMLQPFMYLGGFSSYDSWHEGQGARYLYQNTDVAPYKLTAITHGDPLFSGYYPNCASVFGFLDDADDLSAVHPGDELAYHVVGWYVAADATDEPLAGAALKPAPCPLPTADDIAAKTDAARRYARFLKRGPTGLDGAWSYIEDKKWLFTAPGGAESPTFTLCSGLVQGVTWDAHRDYMAGLSGTARVAVGNTSAEAMSALVRQQLGDAAPRDIEVTLNALQLGVLRGLDEPHGKGAYDEALHRSHFGSAHGGVLWQVSRRGDEDPGEVTLPPGQAHALNALNALQIATDELADRIAARERQFFADWHKYQVFMRTPRAELEREMSDISAVIAALQDDDGPPMRMIEQQIAEHESLCGRFADNRRSIEQQSQQLKGQLDDAYDLTCVPAPRYWQTNDPVLLLSGDVVEPILRHGGDGRLRDDGYLECRLTTEVLEASAYDLGSNPSLPHAAEIAALVAEAALQASGGLPRSAPQGKKRPSDIGVVTWTKNAWLPLLMEWRVYYRPMVSIRHEHPDDAYPRDLITSRYDWNDAGTDLVARGATTTKDLYAYKNLTVLSDHPAANLADAISDHLDAYGDEDTDVIAALKQVQTATRDLAVLAQSLGGFQRGLLMERQVMQLGLADPLYELDGEVEFWRRCAGAALKMDMSRNDARPDAANNFAPIRAGFMRLDELRLVGVFGRTVDVEVQDPAVARSLSPPEQAQADEHQIALPPGATQPCRLLFDWLSAANYETDEVEYTRLPAASPVCGWVLFNHLDNSLVFHDSEGEAVGSLALSQDEERAIWQGAPGPSTFTQTLEQAFAGRNPHLGAFARGIADAGAGFLRSLLLTIDGGLATVLPAGGTKDTSTAVLLGRPLALVRASLRLSLQGGPAVSQSWETFQRAARAEDPDRRSTGGFEAVQFPVRLGKVEDLDDGLLGYFLGENYEHFYSAAADGSCGAVTPPGRGTLLVDGTGAAVTVTMLIDPRAKVRATVGMVPSQTLVVPPDQVTAALRRMSVTFLTAPVLCTKDSPAFPVPGEGGGVWSWLTHGPSGDWPTATVARVDPGQTRSYSPQTIVEGWLRLTPSNQVGQTDRIRDRSES